MKFFGKISLSLLGAFVLVTSAHAGQGFVANYVDGFRILGDSGVNPWPQYSSIQKRLIDAAQKYPSLAQYVSYGKTVQGRDLSLLRIESPSAASNRAGRPAVEISGTIHGNEYLGIEDDMAVALLEHQKEMPGLQLFLAAGGVIYFIPIVNPDGFTNRGRANSNGTDLNRDFDVLPIQKKAFLEPETASLSNYLEGDLANKGLKLKFSLDYHCCVPALITPWDYTNAYPTQPDLAAFGEISEIQKRTLGFNVGNAADTVGYLAVGTSVDYFYAKYGTLAFTIEGDYGGEASRLQKHLQFLDDVFKRFALKELGLN